MPPITIDISAKVPTGGLSRIRLRSSSVILSISVSFVIIESISLYNQHGNIDEKFSACLATLFPDFKFIATPVRVHYIVDLGTNVIALNRGDQEGE
jgi:hypothetical protein